MEKRGSQNDEPLARHNIVHRSGRVHNLGRSVFSYLSLYLLFDYRILKRFFFVKISLALLFLKYCITLVKCTERVHGCTLI